MFSCSKQFIYLQKSFNMKRVIFLLFFIIPLLAYSQEDTMQKRKQVGTNVTKVEDLYKIARDPSITGYSRDLSHEAAETGWGTSRWDKGTFDPEKDLKEMRRIEQEDYSANQFKIVGMVVGIAILVCIIAYFVSKNEKKKKNSDWNSSSTLD